MSTPTTDIPSDLQRLEDTTSFFHGLYTAQSITVTISCALALYNSLELLLLIFTTFRRYGGLYFWSLVVATAGVVPYTMGFMIQYFRLTDQLAGEIISTVGWPMLVTGQSVVLYSRLGIVLGPSHQNVLKVVKWMIIVDGVVLHTVTSVVMFGAYNAEPNRLWAEAYKHTETVQMTIFTVQEFILSGLYIWRTADILKTTSPARRPKRIMRELFAINVLIVIMDIALLAMQYQHRHVIEQALKVVIYSVKLKLEFAILNKLINVAQRGNNEVYLRSIGTNEESDQSGRRQSFLRSPEDGGARMVGGGKDWEKGDAQFIERMPNGSTSTDYGGERKLSHISSAETVDQQRRRRDIEMDDYANACRDVAG